VRSREAYVLARLQSLHLRGSRTPPRALCNRASWWGRECPPCPDRAVSRNKTSPSVYPLAGPALVHVRALPKGAPIRGGIGAARQSHRRRVAGHDLTTASWHGERRRTRGRRRHARARAPGGSRVQRRRRVRRSVEGERGGHGHARRFWDRISRAVVQG
jgi:hypothetical protein